jgi:GNAT superfamily N-acetyltransferase
MNQMKTKVVKIRRATIKDAQRISDLAQAVALEFIVDEFSLKGRALYLQQLAPEVIAQRLAAKDFHFLVAEDGQGLVGVAAMQGNWHLYHLFVAKVDQRGGLGRRLWQILRDQALTDSPPRSFKANVPRYAIAAYTRLGFEADGAMRDEKGVRFQPMTSPAKRLGAVAAK